MTQIFISYSHDDKVIADDLARLLRRSFDQVWYDEKLTGGVEWENEILSHVRSCDTFIFLLSPESLKSKYCLDELTEARKLSKAIIPVKVRRSTIIPDDLGYLKAIQIIDMQGDVTLEGLNEIYASIIRSSPFKSVSEVSERQYEADLKLLKDLWSFMSTGIVKRFCTEVDSGTLAREVYDSILKYRVYRSRQEYHFRNNQIDSKFKEFDQIITEYAVNLFRIFSPMDSRDDYYAAPHKQRVLSQEDYERSINAVEDIAEQGSNVYIAHQRLVSFIQNFIPEFDFTSDTTQ